MIIKTISTCFWDNYLWSQCNYFYFLIVFTEWSSLNTEKQLILLCVIFLVRVKLPNTQIHTFQANMTEWGHYGYDTLCIFRTVGKFSRTAAVAWKTHGQCHPLNKRGKSRNRLLVKIKSGVRDPLETGCTIQNPNQLQWKPSLHTALPSHRRCRMPAWCLIQNSGLYSCTLGPTL